MQIKNKGMLTKVSRAIATLCAFALILLIGPKFFDWQVVRLMFPGLSLVVVWLSYFSKQGR